MSCAGWKCDIEIWFYINFTLTIDPLRVSDGGPFPILTTHEIDSFVKVHEIEVQVSFLVNVSNFCWAKVVFTKSICQN